MILKLPVCLVLMGLPLLAMGQTTAPATRQSTVGMIAGSATDVVPLGIGANVPKLTLKSVEAKPFDLNASVAGKPTVLIF